MVKKMKKKEMQELLINILEVTNRYVDEDLNIKDYKGRSEHYMWDKGFQSMAEVIKDKIEFRQDLYGKIN
jgi:hypothetical protein